MPFALGGGTAGASDYGSPTFNNGVTLAGGILTIPANVTTFTVTVPAATDAVSESGETVPLTIGGVTGTGTISGSILPTLSINDVTVNETAGTATFTVSLSSASAQSVSVNYATANGTASSASDYTSKASTTLTFAAGVTTQTVTVNITNDAIYEGATAETFFVNLSGAVNATIADNQGIASITDNETAPTVSSITSPTVAEGTSLVYAVTLSGASSVATSIPFSVGGGSATAVTDYGTATFSNGVTLSGGNLSIPAGVSSFNVIVPTVSDANSEPGETVPVTVGGVTGVGTIAGTDPTISINDVSVNESAGTATFTVTLSSATTKVVDVNYSTSNGSASAGSDYGALSSTKLTFAAGETSKTITVNLVNDTTVEANETFNVVLATPVNATIADGTGVATIIDNDAAPAPAPFAAMAVAASGTGTSFADADETVKVVEDTVFKGSVLTGTTSSNGTVSVTSFQVKGDNTVYKAGESASVTGVGTLEMKADGTFTFTPVSNYTGSVPVVTYSMTDGVDSDSSTLTMSVQAANHTPTAVDDQATAQMNTALNLTASTLLINDADSDGDPLTLLSVQDATHGTVSLIGNDVVFTPADGYYGNASFTYTASDGHGGTATATVDVLVNAKPTAVADSVSGTVNTPLTIDTSKLLSNDSDANGDALSISSVLDATHGSVSLQNGAVVFTPDKDYVGDASFTYTISDGHGGTASASVSVTIAAELIKAGSTP